ncbi:hypothetical protein VTN00DRAFT_4951 [Thermoascus crustaceus]|uniref:uncharacterized protein n=1 Tax=Thermoascus crustaceus TaxID=5088 RepID=UPI0037429A0F
MRDYLVQLASLNPFDCLALNLTRRAKAPSFPGILFGSMATTNLLAMCFFSTCKRDMGWQLLNFLRLRNIHLDLYVLAATYIAQLPTCAVLFTLPGESCLHFAIVSQTRRC